MKNKIILAVTAFIVLVVAVIGVLVFGTGRLWSKGIVSLSVDTNSKTCLYYNHFQ